MCLLLLYTVLTPNAHQYNITEKIKEANSILFSNENAVQRQSQPKVKFRDHKLVDFEPEDGESMAETQSTVPDEVSDDGYSDEIVEVSEEKVIDETIEIEDVCEQVQQVEAENVEIDEKESADDENYDKESFHDEVEVNQGEVVENSNESEGKPPKKLTSFRPKSSKVNPTDIETRSDRRKICCGFKESVEYKQSLPKYNGFSSNYGLSKEEISRREFLRYRHIQHKQQRIEKKLEQKDFLAKTNEEAFAKW